MVFLRFCCLFEPTSTTLCAREFLLSLNRVWLGKQCFGVKFWKWKFWWNYMLWGLNPKTTFFSCWFFYACVCFQHKSKRNCSRYSRFCVLYLHHMCMLFEVFFFFLQIVYIQGHTKELQNITSYGQNLLFVHFNAYRLF